METFSLLWIQRAALCLLFLQDTPLQVLLSPYRKGKPSCVSIVSSSFSFFCFLGPHLQHMEVPRLGAESDP